MWAIRVGKFLHNGINPLPYALDELPWEESSLIDDVMIEIAIYESEEMNKTLSKLRGKSQ